jgi:diguanylate cyclase (GGDEF)-like protein/PAS domain S-box-containing protein
LAEDSVTQREAARRESEEQFRMIFEHSPIGISLADREGRLIAVNPARVAFGGYTEEELRGIQGYTFIHPDDLPIEMELYREFLSGKLGGYEREKRFIRKDGSVAWARVILTRIGGTGTEPEYALSMVEDITERKLYEERLRHQALHDSLTDLPNRTLLLDRLQQAVLATGRDQSSTALLLLDLDHFKEINDAFGHQYGDICLQQISTRLQGTLRESDTVARLGGDEFAVLLPSTDEQGAILAADKVLSALSAPLTLFEQSFVVGVSIGIVLCPRHGRDAFTLLQRADIAMYGAKRTHSSYAIYASEQDRQGPRQLALMGELHHALEHGQLVLHYQPIVDLISRDCVSAEALVRWRHRGYGLLLPDQFIPLADHIGLIHNLGLWVMNAAMQQLRTWCEAGLEIGIAVNLSAQNLHDPTFLARLRELLEQYEVAPELLTLEMTETAIMADAEGALDILCHVHEMGVRISIDDFGTGYSSLAYLKRLPVDELKIDTSFIHELSGNEESAFIARSVIELGHNLGFQIVAEGVEDQATWNMLAAMRCDLAQGYLIGHPMPAGELPSYLLDTNSALSPTKSAEYS